MLDVDKVPLSVDLAVNCFVRCVPPGYSRHRARMTPRHAQRSVRGKPQIGQSALTAPVPGEGP
jgi:hypothetical protein